MAKDVNRPGAVVVGGDYQGLAIARSIGRLGAPVCVLDDELSIAPFSRYVTHRARVSDLRDESSCVAALLGVGSKFGLDGWVVFPTREETVAACSRHREELSRQYRIPTPGWDSVQWAWDKRNTDRRAGELGIPTPRTWQPSHADELPALARHLPVVIKPAIKEHFFYDTGVKAWRADTMDELVGTYRAAAAVVDPREILIQELIPGTGEQRFAYCAFFKDGRALASMTVRRLRQHPPQFGRASTLVETVELPALEEPSIRFLAGIGYYGLVELEYMLDPRDQIHKLLDVNARTWGYHSIGAAAGVDFPALLFADQMGEGLSPQRARAGVRWIRVVTDTPTALREIATGSLGLRQYLRSLRGLDAEAVLTRDDPLPFLAEAGLLPYLMVKKGY
jgi:predicted ATP-grasp superfamily ATP-dependent carboligase